MFISTNSYVIIKGEVFLFVIIKTAMLLFARESEIAPYSYRSQKIVATELYALIVRQNNTSATYRAIVG